MAQDDGGVVARGHSGVVRIRGVVGSRHGVVGENGVVGVELGVFFRGKENDEGIGVIGGAEIIQDGETARSAYRIGSEDRQTR